jgi:serine/threonine-protein kinase HipA
MTAVWLYGARLGDLSRPRAGKLRFDFSGEAIDRWGNASIVLSTSMPASTDVRPTGDIVSAFFKNVLPEGDALTTFRTMYQAFDDFALLEAIGRDTAGALVVADDPTVSDRDPRYLSIEEVAQMIYDIPQRPLGASLVVRHSLAGAQHKLLLGRTTGGRWYESSASHPSTHLLKPAPLEHAEIATNEAFCMNVARSAGFETCATEEIQIGAAHILVAKRYDRIDGTRIHQEDGCQMQGLPPDKKYQERKPGGRTVGASLAGIAAWLSEDDKARLLEAQVLNILVGNADCHGKNISVLHLPDGTIRLAPLYDVMSTVVHHPIMTLHGPKPMTDHLGMLIGNARTLSDVTSEEFVREAAKWPIGRERAADIVRSATERIVKAAGQHEGDYPEIAKHIYETAELVVAA